MHHIHRILLPRMRTMGWVLIPGRAGKIRSLRLVLNGNNPRFPWEPSTTMLTYRLTGTTDESVSNRDEPNHCAHPLRTCLLYTSPSPRDGLLSRMPSSA